jgi:hypothetical protein
MQEKKINFDAKDYLKYFPTLKQLDELRETNNIAFFHRDFSNYNFLEKITKENLFDLNPFYESDILINHLPEKKKRLRKIKKNKNSRKKNKDLKKASNINFVINEESKKKKKNSKVIYKRIKGGKYKCLFTVCKKVFDNFNDYETHFEKDKCAKNNYCNLCSKYYFRPESLKRHINSIHNKQNFNCNLCDKIFNNSYSK